LGGEEKANGLAVGPTRAGRAERGMAGYPLDHLVLGGAEDSPALLLRSGTLTFGNLRTRVAALAGWLKRRVPEPGARVASWAAKGELTCLLPLAAARARLVHVPINPQLKPTQVAHILADSGARLLIGNSARLAMLEPGDVPSGCSQVADDEAICQAAELGLELPPSAADPGELAAILYTSGSTGRPKGVMLSHTNLWLGAQSVAGYLGLQPDDRTLAVLPLSFDYGQNQLLSSWYAGASVVPLDYLTAVDVRTAIERHGITTLAAVPPLWVQLAELDWPPDIAGNLRRLTNSGGALTPDLVRRLRTIFPQASLFAMYGLTEAFRSTYLDPALIDSRPTSMGKAIPFAEVLVVGDGGGITADGEEGELVHCGPLVAQGYWQDPQRTAERFRPAPPQSSYGGSAAWSGDRVWRDADGFLYFVGRRDAMIKSSGNRISPQEIEDEALATGLVAEAAALGIPDERLGHAVHLVVRALPGVRGVEAELPRILAQRLPGFMKPKAIHWRSVMPVGPNGKIDRQRLVEECRGAPAEAPADLRAPAPSPAGELRVKLAEIMGVATIRDEDTFVSLGGDSLNYVQASILFDAMPGDIPEDWEQLPFAKLEAHLSAGVVASGSAAETGAGVQRSGSPSGHAVTRLEPSVILRAIAIMLIVLNHTLDGRGVEVFAGATGVLLLIVGMNFARFQLSQLEIGGSRKVIGNTLRKAVLPYFAVLTFYFIKLRHVYWPEYLLYSNFTRGVFWEGERRLKTFWFLEVYISFILLLALLYFLPSARAFSRRQPKALPMGLFILSLMMAEVARPYSQAGVFYEYTLFSALPLLMFGWMIDKLKSPGEKYLLLLAGFLTALVLPLRGEMLTLPLLAAAVPTLMFVRRIPVASGLARPLSLVAGASFYIYLLHGVVVHAIRSLFGGGTRIPLWSVPFAYLCAIGAGLLTVQGLQRMNAAIRVLRGEGGRSAMAALRAG
jgi:acyl-CoA ligase (AMP-forming) (exosortase A-associated)